MMREKRSEDPNENERNTTTDSVAPSVRRFVVFRRYEAIETWFVEAPTLEAARERVFPDDPAANTYFAERGGAEPTDSAITRELAITPHEVRRFPANVTIFYGPPGTERRSGPAGDPPTRHTA